MWVLKNVCGSTSINQIRVALFKISHTSNNDLYCNILIFNPAKTEVLKLLARVSLRRQGFAQLLVWMQKLKLCGVQGAGRLGGEFNY